MGAAESKDGTTVVANGNSRTPDKAGRKINLASRDGTVRAQVVVPPKAAVPTPNYPGVAHGWFSESQSVCPGQKLSLALQKSVDRQAVVAHRKSDLQDILLFESAQYGKVLALNQVIQLTARDERAYHEMMVHIPLYSHRRPRNVLVLGGGDGAAVREICRHDRVESITLVEIDPAVVEISKEHLNDVTPADVWKDRRLEIVYEDAFRFLTDLTAPDGDRQQKRSKQTQQAPNKRYDVIIADILEPAKLNGEATSSDLGKLMHAALNDNGIMCAQGGCFWIHEDRIKNTVKTCSEVFDMVEYASTNVPSYPCGQIGFVIAQKGPALRSCQTPLRWPTNKMMQELHWYSTDLHRSSFTLPNTWKIAIDDSRGRPVEPIEDETKNVPKPCFGGSCAIL